MGETGETLIARKEGDAALFLNPLRYDPDAALKEKLFLVNVRPYPFKRH